MNITPAQYGWKWRNMNAGMKSLGAKPQEIAQAISVTVLADLVDGEIIWDVLAYNDADNKAVA